MSINLTAEYDPTIRAIAQFLFEQLNKIEQDEIEVASWLDFDGLGSGAAGDMPLLQVYRLSSRGPYLETSVINIDYVLYSAGAYAERPGILRTVEVAIAHLIQDKLPYAGLPNEARCKVQGSDRGFLKFDDGPLFPFTRITAQLTEVDVVSPVG